MFLSNEAISLVEEFDIATQGNHRHTELCPFKRLIGGLPDGDRRPSTFGRHHGWRAFSAQKRLAKSDAEPFNVNPAPFGDLKVAILMDGNQHGQGDQKRHYILQDI